MKLLEPIRIGAMELPNRIVFPPIGSQLAEEDGTVGDSTINYYARRAEGGAGLVIVEYTAVDDRRYSSHRQLRLSNDSFIPGMRRLAAAIKAHGVRAAVQIHHPGRQGHSSVTGLPLVAPSPIPCPVYKEMPLELTSEEIGELIERYALAAVRAREAGFDAVEVHGAHGYLVSEFLSPYSNKRKDEYGGDTAGRARFATEIIRRAKALAGSDFPIMLRISGDEHVPGGITAPEAQQIARLAIAAGADAIDVSAGTFATGEWVVQPQFWPRACLAPLAAAIKPAVSVPLIVAGRINDALIAERVLQEGNADLVAIGRGLIADPDLPRKAMAGSHHIHRCIACNTCMETISRRWPLRCLINPEAGREGQVEQAATVKRKVLVVGGGPGGLEAARIARLRGHEVTLWEEKAKPDGPWAYLVGGFVKDRLQRLRDLGVRVQLGQEVTAEAVVAARPDVALVVPRLVARPAPFAAIGAPKVLKVAEALRNDGDLGKKIAVLGGDGAGLAVTQELLKRGAAVTVVEPSGRLGSGLEAITRKALLDRLRRDGMQTMRRATPLRLAEGGLVVGQNDGTETVLTVDTVVVAQGYDRDDSLLAALQAAGMDTRPLPAVEEPRRVIDAMEQGAEVARTI